MPEFVAIPLMAVGVKFARDFFCVMFCGGPIRFFESIFIRGFGGADYGVVMVAFLDGVTVGLLGFISVGVFDARSFIFDAFSPVFFI